ncbi:MAG: hypothetical protein F6K42_18010, partial [Leptolyngbya sp. SIO1D8]|nr:hypothetical protein [Leptolyngbya sp. SIO1D8]
MVPFPDDSAFAIQTLSVQSYSTLRRSLLEQATQPTSLLVTEADLAPQWRDDSDWEELLLVVTPTTQGLLVQRSLVVAVSPPRESVACAVGMMTAPQNLITAIAHLLDGNVEEGIRHQLLQGRQKLRDRPAKSCSHLILSLLPGLAAPELPATDLSTVGSSTAELPAADVCQPVQAGLDQALEHSVILNQVITKIRQSLDVRAILSTTVEEGRQYLEVDRLLIY